MRQLLLLAVLTGFLSCRQSNNSTMPMCHDPNMATAQFASFASDAAFRNAHPAPLPTEVTHAGTMVEFPVEGGPNGHAFLMKSHNPTNKYLLLFHEWWGLNDYAKNETAMWCHELGINVMAIDLYDGKVATTPDSAGAYMQANDPARSIAIIKGAAKYAGDAADFRTLGWCFGGGWSLQAALALGDRVKGCVMYYGMPEKDVEKLKTLSTDVFMVHAQKDQWINGEVVSGFKKNMEAAGKKLTVVEYDADHAFANPSNPKFDKTATEDAHKNAVEFLKSHLK